jgi:hypothetical protein
VGRFENSGLDRGSFGLQCFCAGSGGSCPIFVSVFFGPIFFGSTLCGSTFEPIRASVFHSILDSQDHFYEKEEQREHGAHQAQAAFSASAAHA